MSPFRIPAGYRFKGKDVLYFFSCTNFYFLHRVCNFVEHLLVGVRPHVRVILRPELLKETGNV